MKKIIHIFLGLLLTTGLSSCQDWFIEKPAVTGMNMNEVFSTYKNAEGAIAEAYGTILSSSLPAREWVNDDDENPYVPFETTEAIMGGEDLCSLSWGYMNRMVVAGMLANSDLAGAGYTDDYFPNNYAYIRKAWMVYENIHMVADISDREKEVIRAEMQTLVAYRYVEMFKRYGGVPIVEKTLSVVDSRNRATVQETLDFIVDLCDEAAATLEGHSWPADWGGRVTKGVALAVKAEALIYAARPLFNANEPYMQMPDPANNEMIWLGGYDASRWAAARAANQAVIDWGRANGFELIDTNDPLSDYGTATGVPSNKEVLLAYKQQRLSAANGIYKNMTFPAASSAGHDLGQYRGTSYGQLLQYRKADGTDQTWPGVSNAGTEYPAADYREKAEALEPRAQASLYFWGINPKNNSIGYSRWDLYQAWQLEWRNSDGCAKNIKWWWNAGAREWFEFPIYRMAEFYLNIAEAYNEEGNSAMALQTLNIIRDRGGIPDETVTDQAELRRSIQREWAVEFYQENQWYPHARHWKMGNEMIRGNKWKFNFTQAEGVTWNPRRPEEYGNYYLAPSYTPNYTWDNRMSLSPFTLEEVNKGYLVQNPGY